MMLMRLVLSIFAVEILKSSKFSRGAISVSSVIAENSVMLSSSLTSFFKVVKFLLNFSKSALVSP